MKRLNWMTAALASLTLLPLVLAMGGCFVERHDYHDRDRSYERRDFHDDHHDADHHDEHGAEIIIR